MSDRKHVCPLCDYIYDEESGVPSLGISAGTPFKDLPRDFKHPDCEATIEMFEACSCAGLDGSSLLGTTVGRLVAEVPIRARVFDEFGIDFCCGGKQTLEQACKNKGLDPDKVVMRIRESDEAHAESGANWDNATVSALADHIEGTHHAYLKTELPRLEALAEKVARVHGQRAPQMVELLGVFRQFKAELDSHTMKEEMVLFPYIRRLDDAGVAHEAPPFGTVANPITCMESEHEEAARALHSMRALTDGYTTPPDACGSWRALVGGLEQLDTDLRTHVHKESSILFPKAIMLEKRVLVAG